MFLEENSGQRGATAQDLGSLTARETSSGPAAGCSGVSGGQRRGKKDSESLGEDSLQPHKVMLESYTNNVSVFGCLAQHDIYGINIHKVVHYY